MTSRKQMTRSISPPAYFCGVRRTDSFAFVRATLALSPGGFGKPAPGGATRDFPLTSKSAAVPLSRGFARQTIRLGRVRDAKLRHAPLTQLLVCDGAS